jgi:hypothetical protein
MFLVEGRDKVGVRVEPGWKMMRSDLVETSDEKARVSSER